jgi:hypothetical protein
VCSSDLVQATISTGTSGISIAGNSASFANIPAGGSGSSASPYFHFSVGTGVACGTVITFNIHMTSAQGSWDDSFTVTVGQVTPGTNTPINEAFATGDPPTGWSLVNGGTGTQRWTTTNPGGRSIPSGMTTPIEIIDSDYDGSGHTQDDSLITPAFDCTGATAVTLQYDTYYYAYISGSADVDVSKDNGSTWTNVTHWTTTSVGSSTAANHQNVNITTAAGGMAQVKVRFHYIGNYAWYWMVDNVRLDVTGPGTCTMHACSAVPGEIAPGGSLATAESWTGKTTTNWPSNAQANSYKVYRGGPADLPNLLNSSVDSCLKYQGSSTSAAVAETPSAGSFYWFLVTGVNGGGEGTPGNATSGPRVVNASDACP